MTVLADVFYILTNDLEPFWGQLIIAILLFYLLATILASGWIANNLKMQLKMISPGIRKEDRKRKMAG